MRWSRSTKQAAYNFSAGVDAAAVGKDHQHVADGTFCQGLKAVVQALLLGRTSMRRTNGWLERAGARAQGGRDLVPKGNRLRLGEGIGLQRWARCLLLKIFGRCGVIPS